MYLQIAKALACPLKTPRGSVLLYQLWRTDFQALRRLALVCKEAAAAVKLLLWTCTKLGAREAQRRMQVQQAHLFLRLPKVAPLIKSADWTRGVGGKKAEHVRVRVSVAFNGRVCIREYIFTGRRQRRTNSYWAGLFSIVGMTPVVGEEQGRFVIFFNFKKQRYPMWKATFVDHDGGLCGLRWYTFLGREHWLQIEPTEHKRLEDCSTVIIEKMLK